MLKHIYYKKDLPVKIDIASIRSYPRHMHNDIQFLYVLKGSVDLHLTFRTYHLAQNDLHYIHSEDLHSVSSADDNSVLIMSIDIKYLEKLFPDIRTAIFTMPRDKSMLLNHNQQLHLKYYIFLIMQELLQKDEHYELRIKEILKSMFELLYCEFRGFTIDKETRSFNFKRVQDIKQTERLSKIIDDIYRNYVDPSTLEEIAYKHNLNHYYLSHLFSQTIGINYRDFINMVRVETSEYDLLSSNLSISHIALNSGFSNLTYYNKHFSFWFGMTPKQYRQEYTAGTIGFSPAYIRYSDLEDCRTLVSTTLSKLKHLFSEFPASPVIQNLNIDKLVFHDPAPFDLALHFYNPDLLSLDDIFFENMKILDKSYIDRYFNNVKIIIEIAAGEDNEDYESDIIQYMTYVFDALVAKNECIFNAGVTDSSKALYAFGYIKTPVYYILEFITQDYDRINITSSHIILESENAYHILAWNLNVAYIKELNIRCDSVPEGSLVNISHIDLNKYSDHISGMRNIYCPDMCAAVIPEIVTRNLEQKLFSKEHNFFVRDKLSLHVQLENKNLCFIDIIKINNTDSKNII